MILDPDAYTSLSLLELKQMQFDEDYQCEYTKYDLNRIDKLPPQISLALPFLPTKEEVEVHRIMNKYRRDLDESDFKKIDMNPAHTGKIFIYFYFILFYFILYLYCHLLSCATILFAVTESWR